MPKKPTKKQVEEVLDKSLKKGGKTMDAIKGSVSKSRLGQKAVISDKKRKAAKNLSGGAALFGSKESNEKMVNNINKGPQYAVVEYPKYKQDVKKDGKIIHRKGDPKVSKGNRTFIDTESSSYKEWTKMYDDWRVTNAANFNSLANRFGARPLITNTTGRAKVQYFPYCGKEGVTHPRITSLKNHKDDKVISFLCGKASSKEAKLKASEKYTEAVGGEDNRTRAYKPRGKLNPNKKTKSKLDQAVEILNEDLTKKRKKSNERSDKPKKKAKKEKPEKKLSKKEKPKKIVEEVPEVEEEEEEQEQEEEPTEEELENQVEPKGQRVEKLAEIIANHFITQYNPPSSGIHQPNVYRGLWFKSAVNTLRTALAYKEPVSDEKWQELMIMYNTTKKERMSGGASVIIGLRNGLTAAMTLSLESEKPKGKRPDVVALPYAEDIDAEDD